MTRGRAFFWGQLSAAIEPIAGVLGAALVLTSLRFSRTVWPLPPAQCCMSSSKS